MRIVKALNTFLNSTNNMKKVLIVDDRTKRQETDLGKKVISEIRQLGFVDIESSIKSVNDCENYDLIIIHRSFILENDMSLKLFTDFAQDKKCFVVLFSGGVDYNILLTERVAEIDSRTLYNGHKLLDFLKHIQDNDIELFRLIYGENWKYPVLSEAKYLLWKLGPTLSSDFKESFREYSNEINRLKRILAKLNFKSEMTSIDQLRELYKTIDKRIIEFGNTL